MKKKTKKKLQFFDMEMNWQSLKIRTKYLKY